MLEQEKKSKMYSCRIETTPRKKMYKDNMVQTYKDNFTFREETPNALYAKNH